MVLNKLFLVQLTIAYLFTSFEEIGAWLNGVSLVNNKITSVQTVGS